MSSFLLFWSAGMYGSSCLERGDPFDDMVVVVEEEAEAVVMVVVVASLTESAGRKKEAIVFIGGM